MVHLGYVVSGRMHVVMDDGTDGDAVPGDRVDIESGHDAWIVGEEPTKSRKPTPSSTTRLA